MLDPTACRRKAIPETGTIILLVSHHLSCWIEASLHQIETKVKCDYLHRRLLLLPTPQSASHRPMQLPKPTSQTKLIFRPHTGISPLSQLNPLLKACAKRDSFPKPDWARRASSCVMLSQPIPCKRRDIHFLIYFSLIKHDLSWSKSSLFAGITLDLLQVASHQNFKEMQQLCHTFRIESTNLLTTAWM